MKFFVLQKNVGRPSNGKGVVYLAIDNWDDYSFLTSFYMTLHDEEGQLHDIGSIKIAFKSQPTNSHTCGNLKDNFESLGENFFSLGQSVDYYRNLASLPNNFGKKYCLHCKI